MFAFQIITSATTVFPSQVTFWTDGSEDDNMSFGGYIEPTTGPRTMPCRGGGREAVSGRVMAQGGCGLSLALIVGGEPDCGSQDGAAGRFLLQTGSQSLVLPPQSVFGWDPTGKSDFQGGGPGPACSCCPAEWWF